VASFEKRHLNVVDIMGNLENYLKKIFNEKNKKVYEIDIYIWENKEIQYELNKIEKMEMELKKLRELINPLIYPRAMFEAFVDKQIEKSKTIKQKYADLPKKAPYFANKRQGIKEVVDEQEKKDLTRILWDKWTDVEIQLERYKACIISKAVQRELSSKWKEIPYLCDFPPEQAWRLCVDGRYQKDNGPQFTVDDEPSFIAGAKRLLNAMLDGLRIDGLKFDGHSPRELTAEYYQQLHDIAIEGTYKKVEENARKQEFELGYAHNTGTTFHLVWDSNYSDAGNEERWEKIACRKGGPNVDARYGEAGHPVGNCHSEKELMPMSKHTTKSMTREERLKIAETIINQYHKEITSAKRQNDEDAKLTAIVRCCQDLEQAHLFPDGNIRTIAFGVLPKLLLENDLRPCILPNPNILDGFSVEELKQTIREGQETFQSWCEQTPER
jgi:hypothetical protein